MSHTGLSTAGAIPVVNQKGQMSMLKVKVQRYVSGRVPKYANVSESESEEENNDQFANEKNNKDKHTNFFEDSNTLILSNPEIEKNDRRLKRLNNREIESKENKIARHRQIIEPEILAIKDEGESEGDEEMDEENIEKRHAKLKQKRLKEEEILGIEEEQESESDEDEEEESEYEESDSEVEIGPRLKPVFVRKKDRFITEEKKVEELKKREAEIEAKRAAEERKRQALKIIEEETKRELLEQEKNEEQLAESIASINTDDETEEVSYESWKLRELKRTKRDKEEKEAILKEKMEVERIRTLTEEERQAEFKARPKVITNEAPKGKYKFLQKYYHRGAFFLDQEDSVFKRDFAQPTLEDHFDKTILPKIMQVKNFGRSGRTKYTHLVDQDTTAFDSPWASETVQTSKFHSTQAGGMKQVFEKPTKKKK